MRFAHLLSFHWKLEFPYEGHQMNGRNIVVGVLFLQLFAAFCIANASTTEFTNRAAFNAAVATSTTSIGFVGILPAGVPFENFNPPTNPLTISGVSFSTPTPGAFVNVTAVDFYSPNIYPAPFIVDSINSSSNNELTITLSSSTSAFGIDYGGLGGGVGTITLFNGQSAVHVFTDASLPTVGHTRFVGFVSTDPITSVTLSMQNDSWVVQDVVLATTGLDLGALAAERAKTLLNRPYFEGAKGYDYGATPNKYANADTISSGYKHCDGTPGCPGFSNLPGIDCSGLVLWSYNTAAGASTTYLIGNPISYEGAGAQCSDQQSTSLTITSSNDLRPGDLLCFKYHLSKGPENHVAMHVGAGEVVEAYLEGVGVVSSSLIPDAEGRTRATYDPHGNLSLCTPGISTSCFDFLGYRRPNAASQIGIALMTHSPVSLAVTDPDGFTIDAHTAIVTERESLREIPGQLYYVEESNLDDAVIAPKLKPGIYLVKVVPKPNTSLASTYSLTVTAAGHTTALAQNAPLGDIPPEGFGVMSNGSNAVPFTPVKIALESEDHRNEINICSRHVIRVLVFSSDSFDVRTIDPRTIMFAGANPVVFHERHDRHHQAVLVLEFAANKIQLTKNSTQAIFQGKTFSGKLISGQITVRVVCEHHEK
jgi:cell wall-associated NlpC family hydrolase